jgi:hypothetical protein
MGLLDFLKMPRSDHPDRKAALQGRSQVYNLLDNIIGFDDDRVTPGEAFGTGLREDPVGLLSSGLQGATDDMRGLMFEGEAVQRPEDVLMMAAAPMAPNARGLLSRSPDVMYSNPLMAPYDMGRGFGDNGGPRLDTRVPYTRSGEKILAQIADIPSAKSVLGIEGAPAAGFTGLKQPDVLSSHTSTGYLSNEIIPPQVQRSIAPLLRRDVMAIVGDPTGRHTVTGVSGDMFPEAVDSKAGFQYMDVPGQGYAGAQSATSSKANEAARSQDPYYMSLMMGEQSGDFSRHQGNIFGQMFKNAPIAQSNIPKVNEAIRKIGVPKNIPVKDAEGKVVRNAKGDVKTKGITTYPFTDFDTVADPNAVFDYINAMPTGTMRAYFLKGMDKSTLQKMGVPKVSDARLAAADPDQIGMDWGTVGYRGFTPDLERGLYPTTSVESTTYDTGIGKVGEAETFLEGSRGIPANLLYRDKAEGMREKGTGGGLLMTPADYKGYEGSPKKAKQRIDDMAVETIDTFLEIERRQGRQAALQYAGSLLSGGRITSDLIKAARKANAPTWMLAAMAPAAGLLAPSTSAEEQY